MADIAILCGATSTIGREFCHELAQGHGGPLDEIWAIVPADETGEDLEPSCPDGTASIVPIPLDLTLPDSFARLQELLDEVRPQVRWLINCVQPSPDAAIGQASAVDLVRLVAVATTETCSRALPFLTCGSRIVNLSSIAGAVPTVDLAVHSAANAFVLELTRLLDHELRSVGIRAVCVCPRPLLQDAPEGGGTKRRLIDCLGRDDARCIASRALAWSVLGLPVLIPSHAARIAAFCARHMPRRALFGLEDNVKALLDALG